MDHVRAATPADVAALIDLWQACGLVRPWNPPAADIALARGRPNSDILVAERGGRIVGSVMVGHDGHRGWVYYVAVAPDARRRALGRRLMAAAEAWVRECGVRKLELMVRDSNASVAAFYRAIGYRQEPVLVFARWLDGTEPDR